MDVQFLTRGDYQICYQISGKVDQPLVVFTHGSSVDQGLFEKQIAPIGEHYRVLTWDIRGHGRSKPMDSSFSIPQAADDLIALIHAAGYQQAVLVGQSMGSYVCQEVIFRHPEIALALISIGAPCLTLPKSIPERLFFRVGGLLSRFYPYEASKKQVARAVSITPEGEAYTLAAMDKLNNQEYAHVMRAVGKAFHHELNYQLPCPLMLVVGAQDKWAGTLKSEVWAARDRADLLIIPDAGHNANYDNAAFFNEALLKFLAKRL